MIILTFCLIVSTLTACNSNTSMTPPEQSTPGESENPNQPVEPSNPNTPSQNKPIHPPITEIEKAYEVSEDGKTVYFGSYPTMQVTDNSIISSLSKIAGNPLSSDKWISYGYYINGERQDYMRYTDIEYNSFKYRGVHFTSYRPYYTTIESSERRSYQDDNGYSINTTYWFAYETLSWRVLSKSNKEIFIVSNSVIDSHEYSPHPKGTSSNAANNYALSTVRSFLNDTFYNTAFSDKQKTNIVATEVDNSPTSTGFETNKYAVQNTTDNIFLLSYADIVNIDYGFNSDQDRKLNATDYAKAQGLRTDGGARYWLRSPNDRYENYARHVDGYGYAEYNQYVYWCHLGIVPAINIKVFSSNS